MHQIWQLHHYRNLNWVNNLSINDAMHTTGIIRIAGLGSNTFLAYTQEEKTLSENKPSCMLKIHGKIDPNERYDIPKNERYDLPKRTLRFTKTSATIYQNERYDIPKTNATIYQNERYDIPKRTLRLTIP